MRIIRMCEKTVYLKLIFQCRTNFLSLLIGCRIERSENLSVSHPINRLEKPCRHVFTAAYSKSKQFSARLVIYESEWSYLTLRLYLTVGLAIRLSSEINISLFLLRRFYCENCKMLDNFSIFTV